MGGHIFIPPGPVFHGIDPHRAANRCLPGQRIPADPSHSALAPTVPGQLAQIGNDDTWAVLGRLNGGDKTESRTGSGRDLPDSAVSENPEVLQLFTEIEDGTFGGREIGRGEYGDVGIFRGGIERKAGYIDPKRLHAGPNLVADTSLEPASVGRSGGGRSNGLLNASRCRSLTRSFLEMK